MIRRVLPVLLGLLPVACAAPREAAVAAPPPPVPEAMHDQVFPTSDGVQLHALVAGPPGASVGTPTVLLVPGWTMPASIWAPQIAALSARYRVVALDPRGQGDSEAPPTGYTSARRGADLGDVARALGPGPLVVVGWSLGVLDALSWVREGGGARLSGFVAVDNSVGEPPVPRPSRGGIEGGGGTPEQRRARFVAGMFRTPQPPGLIEDLTAASLRTPPAAARELLSWPVPRDAWREALLSLRCPVLYLVRPALAAQAANLRAEDPRATVAVWPDVGHAMFRDAPGRFDALLLSFLARVMPPSDAPVAP